jgi:hypothetical protein
MIGYQSPKLCIEEKKISVKISIKKIHTEI